MILRDVQENQIRHYGTKLVDLLLGDEDAECEATYLFFELAEMLQAYFVHP